MNTERERERFEAHAVIHERFPLARCRPDESRGGAVYVYDATEGAWEGWLARAEQEPDEGAVEGVARAARAVCLAADRLSATFSMEDETIKYADVPSAVRLCKAVRDAEAVLHHAIRAMRGEG